MTALFGAAFFERLGGLNRFVYAWRGLPYGILVLVAILNTWIVVGINRMESKRYDTLCGYLAKNPQGGEIELEFQPPAYYLWPRMDLPASNVFDSEYAINLYLKYHRIAPITLKTGAPTKIIVTSEGLQNNIQTVIQ
jgi:hypothetical protein